MPVTADTVGPLLRDHRLRLRLSQPEAARRAGASTRLWSEVERGERPNVSFGTLLHLLQVVGVALEAATLVEPNKASAVRRPLSAEQVEALCDDLRQAAAFGVDLSLVRAGMDMTPVERVQRNDEALSFFDSITVKSGWVAPVARARRPASRRSDR